MKVNFNNLRKQALWSYHRLAKQLNEAINEDGDIEIVSEEIEENMDDLRMMLFAIASVYEPENEDFKDVSEEAKPIATFKPERFPEDE